MACEIPRTWKFMGPPIWVAAAWAGARRHSTRSLPSSAVGRGLRLRGGWLRAVTHLFGGLARQPRRAIHHVASRIGVIGHLAFGGPGHHAITRYQHLRVHASRFGAAQR